jgi:thiol-disulfide isomerase/thioredoxin
MGRLQALTALVLVAVAWCGCDRDGDRDPANRVATPAGTARSEVVKASGPSGAAATAGVDAAGLLPASPHPSSPSSSPSAGRALCEGQLGLPGRTLPPRTLAHAEAPDEGPVPRTLPTGGGRWTWLNFWAAWCGPCKEEMPRLRQWEADLARAGSPVNLAFVSVDDDERQLVKFLQAQPKTGVRATYWLPDGPARDLWLAAMKLRNPPDLPAHGFIDPEGKLRCVVQGVVAPGDYALLASIVARRGPP